MKTALITGASGGIGKALVLAFVKEGYFVFGQYSKNKKEIESLQQQLKELNKADLFCAISGDFSVKGEALRVANMAMSSFKHIDVLVNNAGVDLYKLLTDTTDEEWDKVFDINVKSAFIISKVVLKEMINRNSGKIINISSVWGINGASMESVYSASKFALVGLTKSLAKEVAGSKINVNCVCPGVIDTPMNANFNEQEITDIISSIPAGRLGKSKEIADLCLFLASEKADYINGAVISADGGYSL